MPYKLAAPLIKDFTLERADAFFGVTDPTIVTIAQAMQEQKERRSEFFAEVERVVNMQPSPDMTDEDVMRLRQKWPVEGLKRLEVMLTLRGCNIQDEAGHDLFRFKNGPDGRAYLDMSESEFRRAWGRLEPMYAREIHEKVLEVNQTWAGPQGESV